MHTIFQRQPLNTTAIDHSVAQFVDDNNSIIILKDASQVKQYLNFYFLAIENFLQYVKAKDQPWQNEHDVHQ